MSAPRKKRNPSAIVRDAPPAPAPPPPATTAARDLRPHAIAVAALWGLALLAYSNSFRDGLPYDSGVIINDDVRIHSATAANLHLILTGDYWYMRSSTGLYRPLTTLSYLFQYAVLGIGGHPAPYHVVNFALHALNVALLYWLGLLVLGELPMAAAMAALWAVHPGLTESVTNVVGRADLLATAGVLGGLLCHIRSTSSSGWRRIAWAVATGVVIAIGLFGKEGGIVVAAAIAAYDVIFHDRAPWRARVPGYLAAALAIGIYLYVRAGVLAHLAATPPAAFVDNPLVGGDFWTARFTALKVLGKDLWLLVCPIHLSADYSYNQIPLATWHDWRVLASLVVCAALTVGAVIGYRRQKAACFFIVLLFAALAPTANIFMLIGTISANRFLYLPAAAAAGLLTIALAAAARRLPRSRSIFSAAIALLCTVFAVRTFARNFDWYDNASLWNSTVKTAPNSVRSYRSLADDALARKDYDRAIGEAERAVAIVDSLPDNLNYYQAYATLGTAYLAKGISVAPSTPDASSVNTPQSEEWYRKALAALLRARRIDRAAAEQIRDYSAAAGKTIAYGGYYPLYADLGHTYARLKDFPAAIGAYREALVLHPDANLYDEISASYRAMHDSRQSEIALLEGVLFDLRNTRLAAELVEVYRRSDPESCAVQVTNGSPSLNFACPMVREQMCQAARNVVQLHRDRGDQPAATQMLRSAIGALGCPAAMFR